MVNLPRRARAAVGESVRGFAKLIGVTPRQVSRWEGGQTPPSAAAAALLRVIEAIPEAVEEVLRRGHQDHTETFAALGFRGDGGPPRGHPAHPDQKFGPKPLDPAEGVPDYEPDFGFCGGQEEPGFDPAS